MEILKKKKKLTQNIIELIDLGDRLQNLIEAKKQYKECPEKLRQEINKIIKKYEEISEYN